MNSSTTFDRERVGSALAAAEGLPVRDRPVAVRWLQMFLQLDTTRGRFVASARDIASANGVEAGKFLNRLYSFVRSGYDVRMLGADRRIRNGARTKLPPEFVEFWVGSVRAIGRHGAVVAAYRNLMDRLAKWERGDAGMAIPGYDSPPPRRAGVPVGWSRSHLEHVARTGTPSKLALAE